MMVTMIKIEQLEFSYDTRTIFSDVNFSLRSSEVLQIKGSNGSGKSTLLSVIAGLLPKVSGQVFCFDSIGNEVDDHRTFFSYLSAEANGLYLGMDAVDNLIFWSHLRGLHTNKDHVYKRLEQWGLGHSLLRENFPVASFSTGMRRRLGLARTAMSEAKCWLLDEPLYGLDDQGISLFRENIEQHKDLGGMVIIISHDQAPLNGLVDRVYHL